LALSLVGWGQDAPATSAAPNSTPAPQSQGCCHGKTAMKDSQSCCHHAMADTTDASACCTKGKCAAKDGKSCCAGKEMKAAMKECKKNGCCADGKSCSEAKNGKTSGCCNGACERHAQTPAES
ncbi:MAG: hypothetical protein WBW53_04850, partial [Terriglobales bacterium]